MHQEPVTVTFLAHDRHPIRVVGPYASCSSGFRSLGEEPRDRARRRHVAPCPHCRASQLERATEPAGQAIAAEISGCRIRLTC